MNHIRRTCRSLSGLPRKGGLLIASAAPAVLWADPPLPRGWNKYLPLPAVLRPVLRLPPGWNKHPPPASHVHTPATGSMPGWQLALMAATVMLLVVTSVAIGYPGPDRTPPGARTHRRSDDRKRRHADPQGQLPGQRQHPAGRPARNGFAGQFIQDIAATRSVATGQNRPAPPAMAPQPRMMTAPRLRPRTVQLCIHCHQNPAGFWVSHTSGQTVRRPWCLSCCQWLDPGRYQVIPFDGHDGAGRSR